MDEERQIQSPVDTNLLPRSFHFLLFARGEIDSPFRGWFCLQAPREGDDIGARVVWLLRLFEWDRTKRKDRQTLWHEVDTREGLRASWWLHLLTCHASRFSNSFAPSGHTMRRLPFDSDAFPASTPPGLCAHRAVTKRSLLFCSSEFNV